MTTAIVSGALANKPGNGGNAWSRLSWVGGLRALGFDVVFVEQIESRYCGTANVGWFETVTTAYGLGGSSALVVGDWEAVVGMSRSDLLDAAGQAALLVNIGGHLTLDALTRPAKRSVFFDDDPGFTQLWAANGTGANLDGHDLYFTLGRDIGQAWNAVPTVDREWRPLAPPVVLDDWPLQRAGAFDRFTTVGTWRGPYGTIEMDGTTLGLKVHEFRKILRLPATTWLKFEAALAIDPADDADRRALAEHGWLLVDPAVKAGTPDRFRAYVQQSSAELSAAQGLYVQTDCGWFSDRTVRYLASGRPAVVQDTGWSRHYPAGDGLLAFRTLAEAAAAAEAVAADYERHCAAARAIAEEHFAAPVVVGQVLEAAGVAP